MSWSAEKVRRAPALQRAGRTLREIADELEVPREDVVLLLYGGIQPEISNPEAKASTDGGATVPGTDQESPADSVTGDASRPGAGRTAPATSETMDATAGETAPSLRSSENQDLVADFIARHGVRRFERGASGDPFHLKTELVARGYEVTPGKLGSTFRVRAPGVGQRTQVLTAAAFVELCDEVRRSEGLEPLVRR